MIDFKEITKQSSLYNFHSHTQYCDGHANMRDFALAAIEQHFTHYGYSPHAPIPVDSPCNMATEDVDKYIAEFKALKEEFKDKIQLFFSMEIDFLGDLWGATDKYFDNLNLDYKISSVHFVPCDSIFIDTDGCFDKFKVKMGKYFKNDIRYVVEMFYHQTLTMIERGGFDIIGHFDKISQNANYFKPGIEDEHWYKMLIYDVLDVLRASNLTIEINTKSIAEHHRFFPNERYFKELKQFNLPVIFNSDAHWPHLINLGREQAMDIYNKI